jgi:hypothetical protein
MLEFPDLVNVVVAAHGNVAFSSKRAMHLRLKRDRE